MQKSPIKFDDLAFILLFFFMVVAVVSFGQAAQTMQTQSAGVLEEQKTETISVFLNPDGSLVYDEKTVEPSFFDNATGAVELSVAPDVPWSVVQNAVNTFKCEVVLVI